ncbi:ATP-binding cassette domain-containing protein [Gordonia phosphorivorans]|uniref:ATP-binding cassette domain-containing protein n=1 Tax=Gordonia phosphorivorans TaxID=1056982 RepID=A0ABV6H4T2_9ACTN
MTTTDTPGPGTAPEITGASIRLDGVTKRYRGQTEPAVAALDLTIEAGEIVTFVGPSGCGKTTTLKMINRLIEPSAGRIFIDDRDITRENPDKLRQSIGYVIQSGGLFPHWSVERNVGAVPRMLGWDRARIAERTEYLLDLVGLDPEEYAKRLPRDMSGGQQQRVGVARALAADPPVLLMDEPFGAVDPMTRVRLQDSLLEIHQELRKTIVIVTHDFEEATKLGDRVLILSKGGHVEQFATPAEILANPATDFVADFIGSGARLAQLTFTRVRDVQIDPVVTARVGESSAEVTARARAARTRWVTVLDRHGRPIAWPNLDEIAAAPEIAPFVEPRLPVVAPSSTLHDALDEMLAARQNGALVTTVGGKLVGFVGFRTVVETLRNQLDEAYPDEQAYADFVEATDEGAG